MRFKATVSYDGTKFKGWQIQNDVRTVQGEIEKALSKISKKDISITASGRTDAGVHAFNQVFHFDSHLDIPWKKALNGLLPSDIYIKDVSKVSDSFHARYDAIYKTYIYKINIGEYNVFEKNYVLQYNQDLNFDKFKHALKMFIGRHDFTSFNKTPINLVPNQIREIKDIMIKSNKDIITVQFVGDGFLHHMIRMLIATSIAFAENKINEHEITEALMHPNKNTIPYNVSGCGLYLLDVKYPI